ncbi:hypothetical protein F4804DRAFT_126319 [Jackrogersella minutella]|nr:hypothetical protein F4804DRAFT_126319 [Jackrogersella minutella]
MQRDHFLASRQLSLRTFLSYDLVYKWLNNQGMMIAGRIQARRFNMNKSPDQNGGTKEPQVPQSLKLTERSQFLDRVKDGFPDLARSIKNEVRSIINDSRGRRPSISQRVAGSSSRRSSLSARGRDLIKRHVNMQPKQKDPLDQWMVNHSGGTLTGKG